MTKHDLMDQVAAQHPHLRKRQVLSIVEAFFDTLSDSVARGERIEIRGFGSFSVRTKKPKRGRNPKTGAAVQVPERRTSWFTVGYELNNRLAAGLKRAGEFQTMDSSPMHPVVTEKREPDSPPPVS